eukprot:gene5981-8237_t
MISSGDSEAPTFVPFFEPSVEPSVSPSSEPSKSPTEIPSITPTHSPSVAPSSEPSVSPSSEPSESPTETPSATPTHNPSAAPSSEPSVEPSVSPSSEPSESPTETPSATPTHNPSAPSVEPSVSPSPEPSESPTAIPSATPTQSPSAAPSSPPTPLPTVFPSRSPTYNESIHDPVLQSFSLDMNTGELSITFDRLVSAETLTLSGIVLQSKSAIPLNSSNDNNIDNDNENSPFYFINKPFNNLQLQGNTTNVKIFISSVDYARLTLAKYIGNSNNDTYISIAPDTVKSPYGPYYNKLINHANAIKVTSYITDRSAPYVTKFEINMNNGDFSISFTKPINLNSFTLIGLALQNQKYLSDISYNNYYQFVLYDLDEAILTDKPLENVYINNYNRTIHLRLSDTNLNNIKSRIGLCVSKETCFISSYHPFINDTNNNIINVKGFDYYHGLRATTHLRDMIKPYIEKWDINIDIAQIILFFSESIYKSYFNYSGIFITNKYYNESIRIDQPILPNPKLFPKDSFVLSTINSKYLYFYINQHQLNQMKSYDHLCDTADNCLLILDDNNLIYDTSLAHNEYNPIHANFTHPLLPHSYLPDITPPELISFNFDLQNRVIRLLFSETINIQSINLNRITIQSTENGNNIDTEFIVLSSSLVQVLTKYDTTEIILSLSSYLFSRIRSSHQLGISKTTTYISLYRNFIEDKAYKPNQILQLYPGKALQTSVFIADRGIPSLESWSINLNDGILLFNFTQPIDISTINTNHIILSTTNQIILSSLTTTLSSNELSSHLNTMKIILNNNDLNNIKQNYPLCQSVNNCYLFLNPPLGKGTKSIDMLTNEIIQMEINTQVENIEKNGLKTSEKSFIIDNISPNLLPGSIELNLLMNTIRLSFDEPMLSENMTTSEIFLLFSRRNNISLDSNSETNETILIQLSDYSFSDSFNRHYSTFNIILSYYDTIAIKKAIASTYFINDIVQNSSTSSLWYYPNIHIFIQSDAITDVAGNQLNSSYYSHNISHHITNSSYLYPVKIIDDTNPPQLLSVYLDDSLINLSLYFNKIISIDSISLSSFYLMSTLSNKIKQSLDTASILTTSSFSNEIQLNLSSSALRSKLSSNNIALNQFNTFCYISSSNALLDYSIMHTSFVGMSSSNAIQDGLLVYSFKLKIPKLLLEMELNINTNISVIHASKLIFQSQSSSYTLTGYKYYSQSHNPSLLSIELLPHDVDELTNKFSITKTSPMKLKILPNSFINSDGKTISSSQQILTCSQYVSDISDLLLDSYSLDLSVGYLTLYFNKYVDISTIDTTDKITLYSSNSTMSKSIILTNITVLKSFSLLYDNKLVVSLNTPLSNYNNLTYRDVIHLLNPLGSKKYNTFLSIAPGFIFDRANPPNPLQAIDSSSLLEVNILTIDHTKPEVSYFDIDLNNNQIHIVFTEAVNGDTCRVDHLTLQQDPSDDALADYQLTQSSHCSILNNRTIIDTNNITNGNNDEIFSNATYSILIQISTFDLNQILSLASLILQPKTTYLSLKYNMIQDLSTPKPNAIASVLYRYGIPVRKYIKKSTSPKLLYYNVSIQDKTIDFHFDTTMNCSLTNVEQISFQLSSFIGIPKTNNNQKSSKNNRKNTAYSAPFINKISLSKSSSVICDASASAPFYNYATNIHVIIGEEDLVTIKATANHNSLMKSIKHTFLTISSNAFYDIFSNNNEEILDGYAMPPLQFINDTTSPKLIGFTLYNNYELSLQFNEPVEPQSIDLSKFIMQYEYPIIGKTYPLIVPTTYSSPIIDSLKLLVSYNPSQTIFIYNMITEFTRIQGSSLIFRSQLNTWMSVSNMGCTDTSLNKLNIIKNITALQMGPSMLYWDLNIDKKQIIFAFSEQMNSSFSTLGFAIHSFPSISSTQYALTTINHPIVTSLSSSSSTFTVHLYTFILSDYDVDSLKKNNLLNNELILTYSSPSDNPITSLNPNTIIPYLNLPIMSINSSYLMIRKYIPDNTPPICESFSLDLQSNLLLVLFDEPIDIDSIKLSSFTLVSSSNGTFVTLSDIPSSYNISTMIRLINQTAVEISLLETDINSIKIAIKEGNGLLSYLLINMNGFQDISGNYYLGNTIDYPISIRYFIPDNSPPTIRSWIFDLQSKLLTITFDEVINVKSINPSRIFLLSTNDSSLISSSSSLSSLSDVEIFQFSSFIFIDTPSSKYPNNTWLGPSFYDKSNTVDINGNHILNNFNPILVGPIIMNVFLDMNDGLLLIIFSKQMNLTSFINSSTIGFYSEISSNVIYLDGIDTIMSEYDGYLFIEGGNTRTGQDGYGNNNTIGSITLSSYDIIKLKLLQIKSDQLFLLNKPNGMIDLLGQSLHEISLTNKLVVSRINEDITNPLLLEIELDMGLEILTFHFNEPIILSSFKVSNIKISSSRNVLVNETNEYRRLIGGVVEFYNNQQTIIIQLDPIDVSEIKLNPSLAKSRNESFISYDYNLTMDYNNNILDSLPMNRARMVDNYTIDVISPTLDSFIFDLSFEDVTYLTLYFSEPVEAASINLTELSIQSRYIVTTGSTYTLTGGYVLSNDSAVILIQLLQSDVNKMKLFPGLIRTKQSTYIRLTSNFTKDLNDNHIKPIKDGFALLCSQYISDQIPPFIKYSSLDMSLGLLILNMSEPVNLTSVDLTTLAVQLPSPVLSTVSVQDTNLTSLETTLSLLNYIHYELTTTSILIHNASVDHFLSMSIVILLSTEDLNNLKYRNPLVTSLSTTYLSFTQSFVNDTSKNQIQEVSFTNPLQISEWTRDSILPTILSYEFDMNLQSISLEFSESINSASVNLSQTYLQSASTRRNGYYISLVGFAFQVGINEDSVYMTIEIPDNYIHYMKFVGIGYTIGTSFLSWPDVFVADNAGNYMLPYWDASVIGYSPRTPNSIQLDTISPILMNWYRVKYDNNNSYQLYLFFNEPINLHNVSEIKIYVSTYPTTSNMINKPYYYIQSFDYSSKEVLIEYKHNNTLAIVNLDYYCTTSSGSGVSQLPEVCSYGDSSRIQLTNKFMNQTGQLYFLSMSRGVATDFAQKSNLNDPIEVFNAKLEGSPDCSDCPTGYYMESTCTKSSDRVCRRCTSCTDGYFILSSCDSQQDTVCQECSDCRFGTYIANGCAKDDYHDNICRPCSKCEGLSHISRECAAGLDTICNTCEKCSFDDEDYIVKDNCIYKNGYWYWYEANCCFDNRGKKTPCNKVILRNIQLAAESARHYLAQ